MTQAGGKKKTQQPLFYDRQIVHGHLPWLRENIKAWILALGEVQEKLTMRREFEEIIRSATALEPEVENATASVKRLLGLQDNLRGLIPLLQEAEQTLKTERDRLRQESERRKERLLVFEDCTTPSSRPGAPMPSQRS